MPNKSNSKIIFYLVLVIAAAIFLEKLKNINTNPKEEIILLEKKDPTTYNYVVNIDAYEYSPEGILKYKFTAEKVLKPSEGSGSILLEKPNIRVY